MIAIVSWYLTSFSELLEVYLPSKANRSDGIHLRDVE